MSDTGFDTYLNLCGWNRIVEKDKTPENTAMVVDDNSMDSDGASTDDWGEEDDHFRVSEQRIRDYLTNMYDSSNQMDRVYLREKEFQLFGEVCSKKYVKCKNGSMKVFKKFDVMHNAGGDEGIPSNSNDVWENYVHRKPPTTLNNDTSNGRYPHAVGEFDQMLQAKMVSMIPVTSHFEIRHGERFRGNLLACSKRHMVTFVAFKDKLLMTFDLEQSESFDLVLNFDTEIPSHFEAINAIHWNNPHHINVLKVGEIERVSGGALREMLAVGLDDSSVVLFDIEDLISQVRGNEIRVNVHEISSLIFVPYSFKGKTGSIVPYFYYCMTESVWGLDINHNILVVSDNSHRVTIFDLKLNRSKVSEELNHNIPNVAIIDHKTIAAITYDSTQYILEYDGDELKIVDKTELLSNGWSCVLYPKDQFLSVDNFKELTGDSFIDQSHLVYSLADTLITKSEALGDYSYEDGNLGLAGLFHRIQLPLATTDQHLISSKLEELCPSATQFHRRAIAHKASYKSQNYMLINGTASAVGLWHLPLLLNCCYTYPGTFPKEGEVEAKFNINARVNVIFPIPELQCVLVASNGGHVELMRLVEHRGVYSLRREYVLIDVDWVILGLSGRPKNGGWCIKILIHNFNILEFWIGPSKEQMEELNELNINIL